MSNGSRLIIRNATAGNHGGGFYALREVEIAGNSTVNSSNSRAEAENGGGFDTQKGLKVSTGSRLVIRNATAGKNRRRILCQRQDHHQQVRRHHSKCHGPAILVEGFVLKEPQLSRILPWPCSARMPGHMVVLFPCLV